MSTPAANKKPGQGSTIDVAAQGVGLATAPEHAEEGGEQQGAFRLDALAAAGMEALPDVPRRKIPTQVLFLAGLLVLATAALLAMRKFGMGPIKALGEVEINYDYNKKPVGTQDHQKILADLTTNHVARQVPSEQVAKNPFSLEDSKIVTKSTPDSPAPVAGETPEQKLARLAEEQRLADEQSYLAQVTQALATLKIHGIMTGADPVARIGEETVRAGDTLAGLFTVLEIHDRAVDLQDRSGKAYTLSLDDTSHGATKPGTKTSPKQPAPRPAPAPAPAPKKK